MDDTVVAPTEKLETVRAPHGLRVDLLPPAVRASRAARRSIRDAVAFVIVAIGVVAVAGAGMFSWQQSLERAEARASATQASLLAEQREYAEIAQVLAEISAVESSLETLFADETSASDLIDVVREALPDGASYTGWSLTVAGADANASSSPGGPSAELDDSGETAIGQLELRGTAQGHARVRQLEQALTAVPGLQVPYLVSTRSLDDGRGDSFTIRVTVTDIARTGRFAGDAPETSAQTEGISG